MTWGMVAVAGATVVAGAAGANAQKKAGEQAAGAQSAAAQAGIAEQQRQFDAVQKLLNPYVQAATGTPASGGEFDGAQYLKNNPDVAADPYFAANPLAHFMQYGQYEGRTKPLTPVVPGSGGGSLGGMLDLAGLGAPGAQQAAIDALQQSPQFTSLMQQGENAILQNASATGGLRGGNTQSALAQFRPALLSQLISDQYARLGGLTSMGQNSAAGVGSAGMQTGGAVSALLQQQGAAQAGSALASGQANAQMWQMLPQLTGMFAGRFGSTPGAAPTATPVGLPAGSPARVGGFGADYSFQPTKLGGPF